MIAARAIVGLGAYLGLPETTDPDDAGWADIAFATVVADRVAAHDT